MIHLNQRTTAFFGRLKKGYSIPPIGRLMVSWAALTVLCACSKPSTVHYLVSANIIDHGIIRKGHSVWTLSLADSHALDSTFSAKFRGEAIPVKLSNGGIVFILPMGYGLTYSVAEMLPERLFKSISDNTDRVIQLREISQHLGASRTTRCKYNEVDTERFAADPRGPNADCLSVAFLKEHGGEHDLLSVPLGELAKIAGSNVRIENVNVTITDEATTSGIQKVVPWVDSIPDARHGYDTEMPKKYNVAPDAFFLRR